jgi:hypothetical protein
MYYLTAIHVSCPSTPAENISPLVLPAIHLISGNLSLLTTATRCKTSLIHPNDVECGCLDQDPATTNRGSCVVPASFIGRCGSCPILIAGTLAMMA